MTKKEIKLATKILDSDISTKLKEQLLEHHFLPLKVNAGPFQAYPIFTPERFRKFISIDHAKGKDKTVAITWKKDKKGNLKALNIKESKPVKVASGGGKPGPFIFKVHKPHGNFNPTITISSGCGGSEPCGRKDCITYHGKKKNYGSKPVSSFMGEAGQGGNGGSGGNGRCPKCGSTYGFHNCS